MCENETTFGSWCGGFAITKSNKIDLNKPFGNAPEPAKKSIGGSAVKFYTFI